MHDANATWLHYGNRAVRVAPARLFRDRASSRGRRMTSHYGKDETTRRIFFADRHDDPRGTEREAGSFFQS